MSFVEIKNLTIDSSMDGINFTAVNNISLNIEKGTKVAILGESGAGKSLITKLLAGVLDTEKNVVSSGEVLIDGVNILEELKPFPIGYVFRKTAARVYEKNTHVDEQLKQHFIKVLNIDEEEAEFLLLKWEKHFELEPDTLRHLPRHISQFNIEKSLIIYALANNPKLFILDEPMVGLDPYTSNQVKQYFREHSKNGNLVLFSSHNLDLSLYELLPMK
jgi:ABC-2 type transport system ATP-binding protein